jgi:hypothetical protein
MKLNFSHSIAGDWDIPELSLGEPRDDFNGLKAKFLALLAVAPLLGSPERYPPPRLHAPRTLPTKLGEQGLSINNQCDAAGWCATHIATATCLQSATQ